MKHIGHFLIVLFALFYISSCTNTSVHQAEVTLPFLDLSSDVASINDPQEIPVLKEALKRLVIVYDGSRLRCLTSSYEEVNISQRLYDSILSLLEYPFIIETRTAYYPNDCVARALQAWGVDYTAAYELFTFLYDGDGIPTDQVLNAVHLFVPEAVQYSVDSIPDSYMNSFNFNHALGVIPDGIDNEHMANIALRQGDIIVTCDAVDSTNYSITGIYGIAEFSYFIFR